METNVSPNILDEKVTETLRHFDARFDGGDWSRMDRMLDAIPKSTSQQGSYIKAIIIGVATLLVIFLVYKVSNTSSTSEPTPAATETPEENIEPVVVPAPAPAIVPQTTNADSTVINQAPTVQPIAEPIAQPQVKPVTPAVEVKTTTVEQPKKEKRQQTTETTVPKEKVETPKAPATETNTKGTGKVGLSGLLNLNMDSLKKQKEATQTDTVK